MRLLPLLLLGLAACTDVTVNDGNTDPTAEILAPVDGDLFEEGDLVTFSGTVGDSGSPLTDLDVTWTSSRDGQLHQEFPANDGDVGFTSDVLTVGAHTVTLRAEDPDGLSGTDAVGITIEEPDAVNTAPTCVITAPADDALHDELDTLVLEGTADDAESAAIDLVAVWQSSEDGELGTVSPSSSGGIILQVDDLSPGNHIITLDVEDPDGLNCSEFITVEVVAANTPPTVDPPTVTPDPLYTDESATCTVPTPFDADGDAVTVDVHWFVDGIDTGETTDTLAGTFFDKGETVTCTATPSDALTSGDPQTSADVVVSDSPPTAPVVSIAPTAPTPGIDDLICSIDAPSTDADGDAITYAVTWTLNSAPWTGGTSTTTLTDDTIPAADLTAGTWECSIVPTADSLVGPAGTDSVTVGAVNQPPSVGTPTITPDPLLTDNDALCTPPTPTDPEGDAVTLSFAWTVAGNPAGTNSDTLSSSEFAKDDVVVCEVTPSDATGTGASATESLTVDDTPPTAPTVAIAPTNPVAGEDTLVCEITADSTDADSETVTYTVEWTFDSQPWTGATSTTTHTDDTIAAVDVAEGAWACTVTPTADSIDGPPGSDSVNATLTVDNPPSQPVVDLTPASPVAFVQDLVCELTSPSVDPDGDAVTYAITWTLGSAPYAGATTATTLPSDTVAAADVVAGDWACIITPTANSLAGPPGTDSVTVTANQAPSVGTPTITPSPLFTGTDATCNAPTPTDPENDAVTLAYAWTVNTGPAGGNSSTLSSSEFGKYDLVSCEVTPTDVGGDGSPASASVTVDDTPPTQPTVDIDPASPTATVDDLHCQVTAASTDADSDPVTYTFDWTFDTTPWVGAASTTDHTGDTIDAADVAEGVWSCTATPTAGGAPGLSHGDTVTVGPPPDSPPSQPSVEVSPSGSFEGTGDLHCAVVSESIDPDGDSVSYSFAWTVDTIPWTGANFQTVHPSDTIPGGVTIEGTWECTATPTANAMDGTPGTDTAEVYDHIDNLGGNLVFISSVGHDGDFGGVGGADQFCQDRADAASIPGTFMAWISGSTFGSSPAGRFTNDVSTGYLMMDGVPVANDWGDLTDGTLTFPITMDELGDIHTSGMVPTFTLADGSPGLFGSESEDCYGETCHCGEWTNSDPNTPNGMAVGELDSATNTWTDFSFGNFCGDELQVLCFEQPDPGGLPSAPTVDVTPDSPTVGVDDLLCSVTADAIDPESEPISYTFEWTFNTAPWTGATSTTVYAGDTILAANVAEGTWECTVTPYAQNTAGSPGSDSVTISPQFPSGTLVFVTSVGHNGDFGGLAGADQFCQDRANAGGLPGSYKAWLSDNTGSPATRFNQSGGPYVQINGTQIADDWADLTDGNIDAPFRVNEFGTVGHAQFYFSFTRTNGSPGLFDDPNEDCYGHGCHCDNWTSDTNSTDPGSAVAQPGSTSDDWTDYSFINACGNAYSLMCFQQ